MTGIKKSRSKEESHVWVEFSGVAFSLLPLCHVTQFSFFSRCNDGRRFHPISVEPSKLLIGWWAADAAAATTTATSTTATEAVTATTTEAATATTTVTTTTRVASAAEAAAT